MSDWFYVEGGKQLGPISESKLDAKMADGTLCADTKIWKEGMGDWISVSERQKVSVVEETPVKEDRSKQPLKGLSSLRMWSIIACIVCLCNPFAAFAFVFSLQAQNAHNDGRDDDAAKKLSQGKRMLVIAFILSVIVYAVVYGIFQGWIPML